MYSNRDLTRFIEQSNLIEGIQGKPTEAVFDAHKLFLAQYQITVGTMEAFVAVVAPGKPLRRLPGMRVRVGNHVPPDGGPLLITALEAILIRANSGAYDPHEIHCDYETLHPFMDGNGRSGRVLWLWQQRGRPLPPLLFLHRFYYDSLSAWRER